jgi:hypothetical protein
MQYSRFGIIREIDTTGVNPATTSTYDEALAVKELLTSLGAGPVEQPFIALIGERVLASEIVGGIPSEPKLPWYVKQVGHDRKACVALALAKLRGADNLSLAVQEWLAEDFQAEWAVIMAPEWRAAADRAALANQLAKAGVK